MTDVPSDNDNEYVETITLNTPLLHDDQLRAFHLPGRFKAIRCGRRWGKTRLLVTMAADMAARGRYVGWFAPEYRFLTESYAELYGILAPLLAWSRKIEGMKTKTGGQVDFWTLENELAGRGRRYHLVVIDEAAFTKSNMMGIWQKAIKPTLLDFGGRAVVASNTRGISDDNFFWQICNQPKEGFMENQYHAPTHANPTIPIREPGESDADYAARRQKELVDDLIANNNPLVYQQEHLAEFVDWSGYAFFEQDKMLVEGKPVAIPQRCDVVFTTIDTAVKSGQEHDGTAKIDWAYNKIGDGPKLTILDWDLISIEGSLLEAWLPTVFQSGEQWAKRCGARMGYIGAWIEDKVSGTVLLQQAMRRNWPAHPINTKLTAMGKDERAISVSGYHHAGHIKISEPAFNKVTQYRDITRNHLMSQVIGFRVGDKDARSRADDLLDCYTYGPSLALGDYEGW